MILSLDACGTKELNDLKYSLHPSKVFFSLLAFSKILVLKGKLSFHSGEGLLCPHRR